LLVESVLEGAAQSGFATEKVYLYGVDVGACVDCRACKKGGFVCVLRDGMQMLYGKLEETDVVVFGTPLYWYGPSGKMKLVLDRLRPYVASGKLKGKRGVLLVPSEEGADACSHVVGMFNLSFGYLGMQLTGVLLPKASEKGEVAAQPHVLDEAKLLGRHLGR